MTRLQYNLKSDTLFKMLFAKNQGLLKIFSCVTWAELTLWDKQKPKLLQYSQNRCRLCPDSGFVFCHNKIKLNIENSIELCYNEFRQEQISRKVVNPWTTTT